MKNIFATMKVLAIILAMFALTGCGGATFAKSSMDPLKGSERVGILVAKYEVQRPGGLHKGIHIHEKVDKVAADKMADVLKDKLARQGFTPVVIPVDEKVAELVNKYKAAPRNFRRIISEPEKVELGDLTELFNENNLDYLLVYEGESVIRPSALQSFVSAGVSTAIGLALNTVVGGGGTPSTFTYTGIAGRDGKFSYYNREQFTKTGDIAAPLDRDIMAEAVVKSWMDSRK